jgi:hypothetical protein
MNELSQLFYYTARYCGDVPVSTNGYIVSSTGTVYGSKVTYECNPGTVASGNLEITCRSDGTWESPPICRGNYWYGLACNECRSI